MDLRAEQLLQRNVKQFGQDYPSLSVRQNSYIYCDQNRPLLQITSAPINKLQINQLQQQQRPYNNTYSNQQRQQQSYNSTYNLWIGLMFLLTVWGLLHIIVGTINIPFCPSRPMIPVFLIVMGCLYITWAMLRIFAFWPRSRADTLSIDLTCKALEGIMIIIIFVWLFLGFIWIYGPDQNINFEHIYFQSYHCNSSTYWVAFISVTLHSAFILSTLLLLFCLLCVGILKECILTYNK